MKLSALKVRFRLALGFGVLLMVLVAMSLLSISRLEELNSTLSETLDFNAQEGHLISQALGDAQKASTAMRNLIVLTDTTRMTVQKEFFDKSLNSYNATEKELVGLFATDINVSKEEKDYLVRIAEFKQAAMPLIQKAAQLGFANDPSAPDVLIEETGPAFDKWTDMLVEFRDYEIRESNKVAIQAHEKYNTSRTLINGLAILGVFISLGVSFIITRSLTRQLGGEPDYVASVANDIASGNLSREINLVREDRSSLMVSIKQMRDQLSEIVGRVRVGANAIAITSGQIAYGNIDLSSRTEQQASALQETASAMEELTSTVKQNSENANQASELAVSASEVAIAGGQIVGQVIVTMSAINESSKKIVDIIGVIDSIAFQINILALNAAIEAARAAEQGRGFAVVATEVRALAQRSAKAAKQIKILIEDSVAQVGIGSKLVEQAGDTMSKVVCSVKRVTDVVAEISSANIEQSAGVELVNQAIVQIDQVTQQNSVLVEEAATAAQALQEQAKNLMEVVNIFKLNSPIKNKDQKLLGGPKNVIDVTSEISKNSF